MSDKETNLLYTNKRRRRVKLVFNPASGAVKESPVQLMDIISQLQQWKLMPEVFLLEPGSDLKTMAVDTMAQGISMFVACGGDGTVSSVAKAVAGMPVTLGIIPTGTQNNIARSLGIPEDIPVAIAILRMGRRVKIDMGAVFCGDVRMPFLEVCSVGLISSLFPSGDEIQHGRLVRIGDFVATFFTSVPSDIFLTLENGREMSIKGHVVMVSNMPYVGRHFKVGDKSAFRDGFLDVLLVGELSKLDLLGCALKGTDIRGTDDPRIGAFKARRIEIDTDPAMPVMADGVSLGEGRLQIEVQRRVLAVMMPQASGPALKSEDSSGK